ncbi:secretin N-terminal domain-containing protein [Deinococcus multiflagellatus]|uniref:Secretin N-terminal domain-containing protein n=1 Tax=Deinococcus multiflagellatus TaxID=1656887 RepID=A0ABW1ZT44_9DEIO
MIKYTLLTAALVAASASALTPLPRTAPFNKNVNLTATSQTSLGTALSTLARGAGLNLVIQDVPAVTVTQSLKGVPTWQAIETLLKVHAPGLDALYDGKFLIIAKSETIRALRNPALQRRVISTPLTTEQLGTLVQLTPGLQAYPFGAGRAVLTGTPQVLDSALALIGQITAQEADPVTEPQERSLATAPLNAETLATTLRNAYPTLTVTPAGTRVVLIGDPAVLDRAAALVTTLIQDAVAAAPAAQVSAAPAPAPVLTTARVTVRLPEATVSRVLQAVSSTLTAKPLDAGAYLLTGTEGEVQRAQAELRAAEQRLSGQAVMTYPVQHGGADLIPTLQRSVPGASFDYVPSTAQLVVQASAADHALVAGLLRQLDQPTAAAAAREVVSVTVMLDVAKATVLAPLLGGGAASTATGSEGAPAASGALRVLADERSNTLILQGPRADVELAQRIIKDLDVELPNVNVRLNVQQVDTSDGRSLGIDWQAGVAGVTVGGGSGGLSVGYDPTKTVPSVNVKLNASEGKNNGKTLLDTSLTAQSGRTGSLLSGGTLMVPKTTTGTDGKTSTSGFDEYNYGLEVRVTPAPPGTAASN